MTSRTQHQQLEELIESLLAPGADAAAIEQRIWERFGQRLCIVFTDMVGFSKRSAREGIVGFLTHMLQMRRLMSPIVARHQGLVLKHLADSQMILFPTPTHALDACIEIQRAIYDHNVARAEADRIYLGCGIGYGDVLHLQDEDMYGVEVNFAAKLGEDIAGPYEILATASACHELGAREGVTTERVRGGRLGGARQSYFRVHYAGEAAVDTVRRARHQRAKFK